MIFEYIGSAKTRTVTVIDTERKSAYPLPLRLDLIRHSTAVNWGYGGSGPAQLALAILCWEFGSEEFALRYYQRFKWDVISKIPMDQDLKIRSEEIRGWAERIGARFAVQTDDQSVKVTALKFTCPFCGQEIYKRGGEQQGRCSHLVDIRGRRAWFNGGTETVVGEVAHWNEI